MRAAILSVCPTLDLRSFKELSSESTITTGFENDLIKYDELQVKMRKICLLFINIDRRFLGITSLVCCPSKVDKQQRNHGFQILGYLKTLRTF